MRRAYSTHNSYGQYGARRKLVTAGERLERVRQMAD